MTRRRKGYQVSPSQRVGAWGLLSHPDLANGQSHGSGAPRTPRSHTRSTMLAQLKALEGITHPSKALGAHPPGALAQNHMDSFLRTQTNQNHPRLLILKPLKECSTPPQARVLPSGIKIPWYPIDGKIRDPA
jgi:hypothetical protein